MTDFNVNPLDHIDEVLATNTMAADMTFIANGIKQAKDLDTVFVLNDSAVEPEERAVNAANAARSAFLRQGISKITDRILQGEILPDTKGTKA